MKVKSAWFCSGCGHKQLRWAGQCPSCHEWNTLGEELETPVHSARCSIPSSKPKSGPVALKDIVVGKTARTSSGLDEFDRCVGGGLVAGSLTLIGGDPGIGKSTLSLQIAASFALQGQLVLYVCGEESLEQTSMRAKRLGISADNVLFLNETDTSIITRYIEELKPALCVIDSIQIMYKPEIQSAPGTVSQVRECAAMFMQIAKSRDVSILLIGHVTKSGDIAGPRVLEHLVDTVLYFEGDKEQQFRLLRLFKNRFGPTDEIAVFQMKESGLAEVKNPSELLLEERMKGASGSCIIPTVEGSRPILIEVQALVTDSFYPQPSRKSTGIDGNRLALLIAVLEKRARFKLHGSDIFVSVTGGIRVNEPACDLGVLLSIASSYSNRSLDPDTMVIGEVGLGGEVRGVSRIEARIKEGHQMGFTRCIIPKRNVSVPVPAGMKVIGVSWIDEAIDELLQ
ncbi:MAG: DNA repair protein RadA [Chlamydiales bacterium]|nr:DNA repair protein RadA [Chlamydiales bacterium]